MPDKKSKNAKNRYQPDSDQDKDRVAKALASADAYFKPTNANPENNRLKGTKVQLKVKD